MPRSNSRSSTFLRDRGYFTYIITTSRITSGELLKQRNGLAIGTAYNRPVTSSLNCSDNAVAAAFADRRPAIEPGHFGVHPSFIEEDEAAWINVGLSCLPQLSPCRHVRSILLGGAQGFF